MGLLFNTPALIAIHYILIFPAFSNETRNYTASVFVPDHDVVLLVGNNQTVVFNVERDSSESDEDMWVQKSILFKKLSLKKD